MAVGEVAEGDVEEGNVGHGVALVHQAVVRDSELHPHVQKTVASYNIIKKQEEKSEKRKK